MKSVIYSSTLAILSLCLLSSCDPKRADYSTFDGDPSDYGGYYAKTTIYDENASSGDITISLHNLMIETHTYYNTYNECYEYSEAGADLDDSGNLELFWSGRSVAKTYNYNREHVWPRSKSNGLFKDVSGDTKGAGSDLHHIRPTDPATNSAHWAWGYGEIADLNNPSDQETLFEAGVEAGIICPSQRIYEPKDEFKGDVARILMYVYVHYNDANGGLTNQYTGALGFGSIFYDGYGIMEIYDLLLDWNESDPVSDIEKSRNEYIYSIQGNRNPFIDYPSLMSVCLGM